MRSSDVSPDAQLQLTSRTRATRLLAIRVVRFYTRRHLVSIDCYRGDLLAVFSVIIWLHIRERISPSGIMLYNRSC